MGVRGLSLSPDISVSDGLLDLFVMRGLDPKSLASAVASIADSPLDPDSFRHWQAKEITIATDPPRAVIGDGESWGETPVSIKVLPGAVQVITPPEVQ
jgi:diacylglycerol kinase family enzyme